MDRPTPERRSRPWEGIRIVVVMLAFMYVVEAFDAASDHRLDRLGVEPRDADGLLGIVFSPFLHVGWGHLLSNSIPFAITGAGIALAGVVRLLKVTAIVGLASGLGTWLTAASGTVTVGASGLVFGYAAYLLSRGIFTRRMWDIGLGIFVLAVFGSALLGGLVPQYGISWQAHVFGAVGGVAAARYAAPIQRTPARGQIDPRAV